MENWNNLQAKKICIKKWENMKYVLLVGRELRMTKINQGSYELFELRFQFFYVIGSALTAKTVLAKWKPKIFLTVEYSLL